jgi:type II secretory pathway pseudopilin PulG
MTKRRRSRREAGQSFVEALLALSIGAVTFAIALPVTASVLDAGRARQASAYLASRLRSAQQDAVNRRHAVGLVFDLVDDEWTYRVCEDRNRNGLRRAELTAGPDVCEPDRVSIGAKFPGVAIGVDGSLEGPAGEAGSTDPVRFASDVASFSSTGSGTPGSVFLRGADGRHYLVRVTGVSGRVRVLRHLPATGTWQAL